jgi:hypothetical protein
MSRKFESLNISDATPEQVRAYATTFLGISVESDTPDSEVLAKVRASIEGDTIFVATGDDEGVDQTGSPPPKVEQTVGGGLVGTLGRDDPKVTLTLHAEERDGVVVNRHKDVGVNGVVWLLKRGESITIPYRVYEALKNAERHVVTHSDQGEQREQVVLNTPFNIERMPPQDEIDAWHAKTDQEFVP